jgi:hypothetical protein
MNTLDYNVSGEKRKWLVRAMSEILGEDAAYQGAPSFAYCVDGYTVSRNGLVTCPDTATHEEVAQLVDTLREQGFTPENFENDSSVFTVEMPRADFTPTALDNLKKIVASKAELFKRAIGVDTLEIIITEDRVRFPWFTLHGLEGETDAYTKLIAGICDMAKRQKRVVARERPITNYKFTMRVFLIRLGFIGPEYQTARTLLLRNLTGNSSWLEGPPPERQRRRRKRLPPQPTLTLPFAKGSNLLEGLTYWLTTHGAILSDESHSKGAVGQRTIMVRWQNQNYNIIQVDGTTCKIEQA